MKIDLQDLNEILKQLNKQPAYVSYADKMIEQKFEKIKTQMLAEFDSHPVTIEIDGGITAQNTSKTLNNITNLYSFIGFEQGDKPTDTVRNILNQSSYRKSMGNNSIINYIFEIPTAQQIFLATPLPWETGRSWVKGIEEGISGLGYYVKIRKNSRSGLGIQSEEQQRKNVRFQNTQYISALIKKYDKKIKELEKSIL
jgi:excinuclease UvrABC ATPase subunit|tara:strand:+ start:111 stop:704 length:594 start_codon:yes stop_codon:yes gene_type:complete